MKRVNWKIRALKAESRLKALREDWKKDTTRTRLIRCSCESCTKWRKLLGVR